MIEIILGGIFIGSIGLIIWIVAID